MTPVPAYDRIGVGYARYRRPDPRIAARIHEALGDARAVVNVGAVDGLGGARVVPVPVPHDCSDGFFGAYWRRPDAYLDPEVRASISTFSLVAPEAVDEAVRRLREDLGSGAWRRRFGALLELDDLDLGYRLVIAG